MKKIQPKKMETTTLTYTGEEITHTIGKILAAVEGVPMPLSVLAMEEILKQLSSTGVKIERGRIIQ